MAVIEVKDSGHLNDLNAYAQELYAKAHLHALDVRKVIRGEYPSRADIEQSDIEIVRSGKALTIVQKYLSMLALRSKVNITVAQNDDSPTEAKRADRLERACHAYVDAQRANKQRGPLYNMAYFALVRGRGGLMTVYDTRKRGLRLRTLAPDPFTYFPVYSEDGLEWFTMEYYRTRLELQTFYDSLERRGVGASRPTLSAPEAEESPGLHDTVRVVEYWDEEYHCYSFDEGDLVKHTHGYGFVPLAEARLNETPEDEQRWAYASLLSGELEMLKTYEALLSKGATGMEQFYFPRMYYTSTDGSIGIVDHHTPPGDFIQIKEGTQPIVLNPIPNQQVYQSFLQSVEGLIANGTLPNIVYTQEIPNVAGFLVQQFLSVIQDAIADKRDGLEHAQAIALGHFLRLAEKFAPEQPEGGWRLPFTTQGARRPSEEVLKAEDIDGHYDVRVSIREALPTDITMMITQANQATDKRLADGGPLLDRIGSWELSGLSKQMEDMSARENAVHFEMLLAEDPETRALWLAKIKADNADTLADWRKEVEKVERKEARRVERQAERESEDALDKPLVIPPEKLDAALLHQLAAAMEQGLDPQAVLEGDFAQMGAFGQQGQQQLPPGYAEQLAAQFEAPTGMTGYEGIAPSVLPPASQGALPRRVMDQTNLAFERGADRRSPALPPRR